MDRLAYPSIWYPIVVGIDRPTSHLSQHGCSPKPAVQKVRPDAVACDRRQRHMMESDVEGDGTTASLS